MTDFLEHLQAALAPGYQLGPELAGGGMSRVFIATDRSLGRKVVVKVLPPDLAAGVNRDRFRREIQLAAHLQHPHIVPLLSAGEDGELLWYTMPFIEGESLRTRVEQKGRLSVREVLRILHDVLDALAYAHARGVVHRDIKPGNILTQGSHALVTDFGVAKAISAALPGAGSTTSGMAIGTPAYMAPEQLAADPSADHRVDLYAVGLLAYELLSGESPFTGPSPAATMAAQLTRDPPPLEGIRNDVPPALSTLVMRCLAKAPEDRPDSAEALLADLDLIPVPSGPTTPTQAIRGRSAPRRRRNLLWGGAAAGLVAVVAFLLLRPGGQPAPVPAGAAIDSAAPADTTPTPAVSTTPAESTVATRPGLTRADSLAIARAFQKELQPKTTPEKSPAGQAGVRQHLIDSLVRVSLSEWSTAGAELRAAQRYLQVSGDSAGNLRARVVSGGPRRVLVVGPSSSERRELPPEVAQLSEEITAELRDRLAREHQYVVLTPDSGQNTERRHLGALALRMRADIVATVSVVPVPDGSVVEIIRTRNLADTGSRAYRVASSTPRPLDQARAAAHDVVKWALGHVSEMATTPTRSRVVFEQSPPAPEAPPARPSEGTPNAPAVPRP